MKKLLSILLTLVLVLGMSTAVLANDQSEYSDMSSVTIEKEYKLTNPGTLSPAETFNFTIARTSVTDAGAGVNTSNMPLPTIGTVAYTKGEAGSVTAKKNITVNLPEYISVGIYTYTINESAGNNAGVTYYGGDIILVVTVIEQNGKIRIAAVHTETPVSPSYDEESNKSDKFSNEYSAGNLEIKKIVTGNLGDKEKYFDVTVTLTGVSGKVYDNPYAVTGGSNSTNPVGISVGTPATFKLKDGETITIANLPYHVTYTVVEADYTGNPDDYDNAQYVFSDADKKIDSAKDTVAISNNKDGAIDTGISLDSIPYMILLAGAGIGILVLFSRKRKINKI
ncbi:MAG TPA: hypothetical protein VFD28_02545 [Candidatus Eisenbacteria bacterium]|nr:hypothetical protein [Candidatus Eisenbacteria bacterium]